ncbi:hypothetical protein JR316_0005884 [Psilocybe cubensis]|uniref:Uncharacterized protein n=1 Tax=Psilocybe cubensis TaxID=181762 RepID=A0ACB8H0J2_PSICU|nr:hypothetical protein JR316_0005884 [Psilocybe cubensis]KAH9481359.1 hypothetical protein JR316_0005884 [Psilocybe cubensis]
MPNSSLTHKSEPSEPQSTLVHSRNLSTVSSVTLHTNTTLHSQPYEPLLRPISPGSGEYYDVVSHQSRQSDRVLSLPRWSQSNVISRSVSVIDEKKSFSDRKPQRRRAVMRWSKNTLQLVMAAWAIYSTVRYFIAFTVYQSITGQAVSLALGTATGLSFAFASCASILWTGQTYLLIHGFSVQALMTLRRTLHFLSSCCLFGPSVVNLVLVFLWKKHIDLELQVRYRCKLDVDLVWSVRESLCNHRTPIIVAFHLIASSAQFTPSRKPTKPRHLKGKKSHIRLESGPSPFLPPSTHISPRDHILQHQSSEVTLSGKSSPRNRLHPSRSHSSTFSEQGDAPSYHKEFIPMNNEQQEGDQEMTGFADRFRLLISQITRETEEALAFARSDDATSSQISAESPPPPHPHDGPDEDIEYAHDHHDYHYDEDDDFYSSSPEHNVSHSDYHQAYPAEEHIRMLNGYIRRMPTIESMGSREWRSSVGASSQNTNRDRTGTSRPPTRGARLSWAGTELSNSSEPRSQSNSLAAQAELLAGMFSKAHTTEIGELVRRGETIRMVDNHSANEGSSIGDAVAEASVGSGSLGNASSSNSYHTASTVSSLSSALADATDSPLPTPPRISGELPPISSTDSSKKH